MAYTTEEQDFQSFLQKLKSTLPQIIIAIALAFGIYFGYNYWQNYQAKKVTEQYQTFTLIVDGNGTLADKANQIIKFTQDNKDSNLAVYGSIGIAKQLAEAGNLKDAIRVMDAIPDTNKTDPGLVQLDKAKLLWQNDQNAEAIAALNKVEKGIWYSSAQSLLGEIYFTSKDYDNAVVAFTNGKQYLNDQIAANNAAIKKIETSTNNKAEIQSYKAKNELIVQQLSFLQAKLNIAVTSKRIEDAKTPVETTPAVPVVPAKPAPEAQKPAGTSAPATPAPAPTTAPAQPATPAPATAPAKPVTGPATPTDAKPAAKPEQKPAVKPTAKPEQKPAAKPEEKPASKPAVNSEEKKRQVHERERRREHDRRHHEERKHDK